MRGGYLEKKWIGIKKIIWKTLLVIIHFRGGGRRFIATCRLQGRRPFVRLVSGKNFGFDTISVTLDFVICLF